MIKIIFIYLLIYYFILMGNKLEPDTQINYVLKGHSLTLTVEELKGAKNFPQLPKEKMILEMWKNWLD